MTIRNPAVFVEPESTISAVPACSETESGNKHCTAKNCDEAHQQLVGKAATATDELLRIGLFHRSPPLPDYRSRRPPPGDLVSQRNPSTRTPLVPGKTVV